MKTEQEETFTLENFEGPLDFLVHLIQKKEIDIYEVSLRRITEQFLQRLQQQSVEGGAEFIGTTAFLLWLKSKTLLPKHEQVTSPEEEELDPRFEIIHQLLDYCRFKEAAKQLTHLDSQQNAFYTRSGESLGEVRQCLGVEHLSLDDLAGIFREALGKVEDRTGAVHEEEWRVSDLIRAIRKDLKKEGQIPLAALFSPERSREELIVVFLAILELMKLGDALIVREIETQTVLVVKP